MTQSLKTRSQIMLLALAIVSIVSACGAGSASNSDNVDTTQNLLANISTDQINPEHTSAEQGALATTGTIIIEERNGKTVFDAYFSQTAELKPYSEPKDNIIGTDTCSSRAMHSDLSLSPPVELGAANSEAKYASVGTALIIESRVGQFEALVKQQVGDITVYAPNARWKSVPIPDDSALAFDRVSQFDQMGLVEVAPLLPLVWLAPETGVMSNPASSLRWEASLDEQVEIRLRLSAIDFSDSQNPIVVTVSCDLKDDGLFTLPAAFQQQLPDDDMGIVVYAVRQRVQQVEAENTSLTVVQLSYPAPL